MATYSREQLDKARGKKATMFISDETGKFDSKLAQAWIEAEMSYGVQIKNSNKQRERNFQIYTSARGVQAFDDAVNKYIAGIDAFSFEETRTTLKRKLTWEKE
jgi:hypothetical protein